MTTVHIHHPTDDPSCSADRSLSLRVARAVPAVRRGTRRRRLAGDQLAEENLAGFSPDYRNRRSALERDRQRVVLCAMFGVLPW